MTEDLQHQLAELAQMTPGELHQRYAELFDERPRSRNRIWLVKRIAWRLQANQEGDLSERARQRAEELANDADLRVSAPRYTESTEAKAPTKRSITTNIQRDARLPLPGTMLTRFYRGRLIEVEACQDGFEFEGQRFKSLTAVVRHITGRHWNGYHFFNLLKTGADQ